MIRYLLIAILILPATSIALEKLIIFHAGSLSIPFKDIETAFNKRYPKIKIYRESCGSRTCARKISDLKRKCDIMASADYQVINNLLIPEYADKNIKFATNEMSIAYTKNSKYAGKINNTNWPEILLRKDVRIGRSEPNSDPCGYRTVLTMKLSELFYKKKGLAAKLINKDKRFIRPKEVDLLALLEVGEIDYLFIYKSVSKQHKLNHLVLPDQINLKSKKFESFYKQASVEVTGKKPGTKILIKGAPMIYGVTIPKNSPNKKAAQLFLTFLLEKENGQAIMKKNGQSPFIEN